MSAPTYVTTPTPLTAPTPAAAPAAAPAAPAAVPAAAATAPSDARPASFLVAARDDDTSPPLLLAARLLAERAGASARVHVLGVVEPLYAFAMGFGGVAPPPVLLEAERQDFMLGGLRDLVRHDGQSAGTWDIEVRYGAPARVIAHTAREFGADLIVMGVGRHTRLDRMFSGETALATLRVADRPVLAVSPNFAGLPGHAVVAVDFGPASVKAAEAALRVLRDDGTLSLVHVKTRLERSQVALAALDSWAAQYDAGVTQLFERLRSVLSIPPGVMVETIELVGDPSRVILSYADTVGADLVAVGTHGPGLFERIFLGSVSTAVLRGAPCSVLGVPEPPPTEAMRLRRLLLGTVESVSPGEWAGMLADFTKRNAGRRTALEIDDPSIGAQVQEAGYVLRGAAYDVQSGAVELMFGTERADAPHLTRSVTRVGSIAVLTDPDGRDRALCVVSGDAQTLLTFLDR